MVTHQPKVAVEGAANAQPSGSGAGQPAGTSKDAADQGKPQQPKEGSGQAPGGTKDQNTTSLHSQLTSSLLETSEDEEAKRKEQEK